MLWQARALRFTAFPAKIADTAPEAWWQKVIGDEPDRMEKQPRQGIIEIRGRYGAGQVGLRVEPSRIDWLYMPADDTFLQGLLGAFGDCIEMFDSLLQRWFDSVQLPIMHRVALGSVLRAPVSAREQGYAALQPLLKSVQIREGVSDFLYQINNPTQVTLGDDRYCGINRLTKWSVAAVETLNASFAPSSPMGNVATALDIFAQIELDINTIPSETTLINASDLPLLLKKLAKISVSIAESGEPI